MTRKATGTATGSRAAILLLVLMLPVVGCIDTGSPTGPDEIDLDALFAPPTDDERAAVVADWESRDVRARDVEVEDEASVTAGGAPARLEVVSHRVGEARHFGAIVVPEAAEDEDPASRSLPVLVFLHPGDAGVSVGSLSQASAALGEAGDEFVYLAPSFRSEELRHGEDTYVSTGEASPWDRDVDDALALLEVALDRVPEADPERIGVLGLSRGATVAMLMAVRDSRIDAAVEISGPTDFFGPFVRGVFEDELAGTRRYLPGVSDLVEEYLDPLREGRIGPGEVRHALLERSPAWFVERLPPLQIHHGTADGIVPVGEAERMIQALEEASLGAPDFQWYLYEGGGHSPQTFETDGRTVNQRVHDFLAARLLMEEGASSALSGTARF